MKNKVIIWSLLGVICFLSISTVDAATQTYTTSLSIGTGSTLSGTKRTHNYDNQQIEFYWTSITATGSADPYMNVTLYKKGTLFYSQYNTVKLTVPTGSDYSGIVYPSSGSGNYYFYFSTGTASSATGAFKADPVYIKSYS